MRTGENNDDVVLEDDAEDGADSPQGEAHGANTVRSTEQRTSEFESEHEHSDSESDSDDNIQDETLIQSDDGINVHHLDESLESEVVSSLLQQCDQLCQVNPVEVDQSDLVTHNLREGTVAQAVAAEKMTDVINSILQAADDLAAMDADDPQLVELCTPVLGDVFHLMNAPTCHSIMNIDQHSSEPYVRLHSSLTTVTGNGHTRLLKRKGGNGAK
jgi:hypothetical protein